MNRSTISLTCLLWCVSIAATAQVKPQPAILLWPNGAPGSEGKTAPEHVSKSARGEIAISGVNFPSIIPYLPEKGKANGLTMVVAPGGGHKELKMDYEGSNFAEWAAERGITCFLLKYRLAKEANSTYTVEDHALKDMQRAIRLVRSRAKEWNVDTSRLGAMGFSAGGELAGLAAMRYDNGNPSSPDIIERQNSKPDFQVLVYPGGGVIEPQKNSPPLFMVAAGDDVPERLEGMAATYSKYRAANIPVELHIYAKGPHGFGVRKTTPGAVAGWTDLFYGWLTDMELLKPAGPVKAAK